MIKRYKNDLPPEVLAKSSEGREFHIDWPSLRLFQYRADDKPRALDGRSLTRGVFVRIAVIYEKGRPERPMAVFSRKQKKGVTRIEGAYWLSDEECDRFEARFQTKH